MTLDDLDRYYNELQNLYDSGEFTTASNKDRAHNNTVLRFMLNNSDTVNIFCGEMSIFRKRFYTYIDENNHNDLGKSLKYKLIDSLNEFLNREHASLNIVLENYKPEYLEDLIDKSLFLNGLQNGSISISQNDCDKIPPKFISHFTFTEKGILRMESDRESHEGVCAFGIDKEMKEGLLANFSLMKSQALPIKEFN